MITLRQHLVSLIAVFLALGLGVVAGSTFISPATVRELQRSLSAIDARDKTLEAENNQLSQANSQLNQGLASSRDEMVQGKLSGRPTDLISFDATPAKETQAVAAVLVEAGARLESSTILSSVVGLADASDRQQVAGALGVTGSSTSAVADQLVAKLADDLAGHGGGAREMLVNAGLARSDAVQDPVPLSQGAAAGSLIVILAPAPPAPGGAAPDLGSTLILPLVRALTPTSAVVAVGEDGSSPLPVLTLLRGDSTLRVVTADSVDTPLGQAGLVEGLSDAATAGVYGDYGQGAGADSVLPTPLPSPSASTPPVTPPVSPASSLGARPK